MNNKKTNQTNNKPKISSNSNIRGKLSLIKNSIKIIKIWQLKLRFLSRYYIESLKHTTSIKQPIKSTIGKVKIPKVVEILQSPSQESKSK